MQRPLRLNRWLTETDMPNPTPDILSGVSLYPQIFSQLFPNTLLNRLSNLPSPGTL